MSSPRDVARRAIRQAVEKTPAARTEARPVLDVYAREAASILHRGMRQAAAAQVITDRMALEQTSTAPGKNVFAITSSPKYSTLELTFVAGALEAYRLCPKDSD